MGPEQVHETLAKYILADGFSHVVDFEKSHGSWFVDARNGQEYLDCYSMHAAMPLSWNHPKVDERLDRLYKVVKHNPSNSDCYSVPYAEFVEAFAKIAPDFQHYFFISGGTLGVENALKAAFDWKAKQFNGTLDVIHFMEAFHGRSGYTLSVTNTTQEKTALYPRFNWTRCINPKIHDDIDVEHVEKVALEKIEQRLRTGQVAAILIEPIQSEGGDNHFRPEFLFGLRRLTQDYETMLIFDEVQTGVGLTGEMWCYKHFGVIPDMMCFGKKTQVSGFCATSKIDKVKDNVFKTSGRINSTFGGNLVDMVRANIYFEIIDEDQLVENAAKVGAYFLSKLQELDVLNARGRGLMVAFDCENPKKRNEVFNKLSEKVVCLKCGRKSIRFRPHLDFTKEHVDFAIQAIKNAFV